MRRVNELGYMKIGLVMCTCESRTIDRVTLQSATTNQQMCSGARAPARLVTVITAARGEEDYPLTSHYITLRVYLRFEFSFTGYATIRCESSVVPPFV